MNLRIIVLKTDHIVINQNVKYLLNDYKISKTFIIYDHLLIYFRLNLSIENNHYKESFNKMG